MRHYAHKIVKGEIYVDVNRFTRTTCLSMRENIIGYVGTFEERKGTSNLIEAIKMILIKRKDLKFILGGIGPLENKVRLTSENLKEVEFVGLIPNNELPKYLNRMKLLILPSLSEGIPNIVLEAMACGTPVLATAVGGIPDLIVDEETGFILTGNEPEHIAINIERVINSKSKCKVTINAKNLINKNYSYEASINRYDKLIKLVMESEN